MVRQRRWILILIPVALLLTGWAATPSGEATPGAAAPGGEKTSLGARTAVIPTLAWVIGSYDADGRANLMTASWVGVCASSPASVLNDAGVPVVEKLKPFVYSPGSGAFYGLGPTLGEVSDLAAGAEPGRP